MRRDEDYGRILPTRKWRGESRGRRAWRALRWWIGAAALVLTLMAAQRLWFAPPVSTPESVSATFHRCGQGRGPNCVIDGDTFIIARRHFRITGIDAPEIGSKARCPAEAARAETAAATLLVWLNAGQFVLRPPQDGLRDEYGRELVKVERNTQSGQREDLAETLIATKVVRRYDFGARQPWC